MPGNHRCRCCAAATPTLPGWCSSVDLVYDTYSLDRISGGVITGTLNLKAWLEVIQGNPADPVNGAAYTFRGISRTTGTNPQGQQPPTYGLSIVGLRVYPTPRVITIFGAGGAACQYIASEVWLTDYNFWCRPLPLPPGYTTSFTSGRYGMQAEYVADTQFNLYRQRLSIAATFRAGTTPAPPTFPAPPYGPSHYPTPPPAACA